MCPDDAADDDEGHGGHGHHTVVDVAVVVAPLGDDLEAKEGAVAEQFTEESDDDEDDGIANTVADTVEERRPGLVHHGEGLQATHKDTVGDDEADVDAELYADVVGEGLEHLGDNGHQRGHHDQLHDDADAVGDGLADEGYNQVGEGGDDGHGETHHDGRLELCRDGKRGADAEHLDDDGVVQVKRCYQCLLILL